MQARGKDRDMAIIKTIKWLRSSNSSYENRMGIVLWNKKYKEGIQHPSRYIIIIKIFQLILLTIRNLIINVLNIKLNNFHRINHINISLQIFIYHVININKWIEHLSNNFKIQVYYI